MSHKNLSQMHQLHRIHISAQPITLLLKRSFNTAHSSSTTRTNFLIKTSLYNPCQLNQNNQQKQFPVSGYGQCGLPPKKPYCYLSDINDCQLFFEIIHQQFQNFLQDLLTKNNQSHQPIKLLQKFFNGSFGSYFDTKNQSFYVQTLAFFKQKYQSLIEKIKNNSGLLTLQSYLYLQLFFLFSTAKQLTHKNSQFKAPRNALQFSLLDLIGIIQNMSVSELLFNKKSQIKISKNFSFYTISHEEDLQSMVQNGQDSLKFTDCIKIKFNNDVQKLVELLKIMDEKQVGRKWIIDANASWSPSDFIKFQNLFNQVVTKHPSIKQKILFIEQPFPIFKSLVGTKSEQQIKNQQNQWQTIKQNTSFIIIADESFATCEDLYGVKIYSHGINIKMEKCGGPFEALKILKQMEAQKVNYIMFGSMVVNRVKTLHYFQIMVKIYIQFWFTVENFKLFPILNSCTQTFQFYEFAQYFDIDGALLVKQPQISGGFEWKGSQGIKKVNGKGLAINQQDLNKLL